MIGIILSAFKAFATPGGIENVIKILRGAGILKDPEEEKAIREQLAKQYEDWVRMTSPPWERVGLWANTFVAVSRPAMAWVLLLALVFFPAKLLGAIATLHEAGPLGLAVIAILLWAYFGRSMEKGVELWFTALAVKWGGADAAKTMPRLVPALPAGTRPEAPAPQVSIAEESAPIRPFDLDESAPPARHEFERDS